MMDALPLVSIITPSFNQARFLEHTILSVLRQDYPAIEYLVVDGGSTDGSADVIHKYSDRLSWWVSEKDSGQAEAINKGIKHSSGEIVAWLNSDDLYLPGAVAQAVEILNREKNLGMVFGDALSIDENGRPIGKFSFGDWGLADLLAFRIICQPAVFIRRSALEQAGLLSPEFHYMLDHQLWIQIARKHQIRHVPTQPLISGRPVAGLWAAARYHQDAKNVSQAAKFSLETMRLLDWMHTLPDLQTAIRANQKRIASGAYRLNARYLLDGNLPQKALASYWQAFIDCPSYGIRHAHRMLFAILKIIKFDWIAKPFIKYLAERKRKRLTSQLKRILFSGSCFGNSVKTNSLDNWPGLEI